MKNKFRTLIVVTCLSYYCPGRCERAVIFSGFLDIEITRAINFRGERYMYVTRFHAKHSYIYSDIIYSADITVKTTQRFFLSLFLFHLAFFYDCLYINIILYRGNIARQTWVCNQRHKLAINNASMALKYFSLAPTPTCNSNVLAYSQCLAASSCCVCGLI